MILTKAETEAFKRLCRKDGFNSISFLSAVSRARASNLPPEWIFRKMNSKMNKEKLRELNKYKCVRSSNVDKGYNENLRIDIDDCKEILADKSNNPCDQLLRKETLKELGLAINGDYEKSKVLLCSCLKRSNHFRQFSVDDMQTLTPFLNPQVIKRFFDTSIPFYR